MRVDDLLEGLLLESANDAAVTIAEGVSGSRKRFVAAMNERARALGLDDTSYANPIGLDDPAQLLDGRRPRGARPPACCATRSSPGPWTGPQPCSSPAPAAGW